MAKQLDIFGNAAAEAKARAEAKAEILELSQRELNIIDKLR